jgi:DivIVA domain-containing protein
MRIGQVAAVPDTGRMDETPDFTVVLRGYDREQVKALLQQVNEALMSSDPRLREVTRKAIAERTVRVRISGYDRAQVDNYLARIAQALAQ